MLTPGQKVPNLDLPLTIQARFKLSQQTPDNFTMLVFYRGQHCLICRKYLEEIGGRLDDFTSRGISVFAVSMDSEERAQIADEEWATLDLPLVYDLSEQQARDWGLYISEKREGSDEPDIFSEPGLFLMRPDLSLYFAVTQNAPFTRPSLDQLLQGVDHVLKDHYPARGTRG